MKRQLICLVLTIPAFTAVQAFTNRVIGANDDATNPEKTVGSAESAKAIKDSKSYKPPVPPRLPAVNTQSKNYPKRTITKTRTKAVNKLQK